MSISDDAVVLGFSYFPTPKSTLAFGGVHAEMQITDRARAALNELLEAGYVQVDEPSDQWEGREYYRGKESVRPLMAERGLNPFDTDDERLNFVSFKKIGT